MSVALQGIRAEFYGSLPTGLLVLEKKYPYYVFVPPDYSREKSWPLLILLGDRGDEPKELIGPWTDWAKSRGLLVTAVPNLVPERENPKAADDWLLQIKQDLTQQYRIDRRRVLLVGFGSGAHYSAYLAMNYPGEFSAAVLIQGSWDGPFANLMRPVSDKEEQVSFFLAADPQAENSTAVEKQVVNLEEKGYRIVRAPLESDKEFSGLRDQMMEWFDQESQLQAAARQTPGKGWKNRIEKIIEDFFEI